MEDNKLLEEIENLLPEIIKSDLPFIINNSDSWWDSIKTEYQNNKVLLEFIRDKMSKKYKETYEEEELINMQKLYLLYPNKIPDELLSCPWDIIKIILNIFNNEKRMFYLKIYQKYNLKKDELEKYILHDLYEKYLYSLRMINDYNKIIKEDIIKELFTLEKYIYENN